MSVASMEFQGEHIYIYIYRYRYTVAADQSFFLNDGDENREQNASEDDSMNGCLSESFGA